MHVVNTPVVDTSEDVPLFSGALFFQKPEGQEHLCSAPSSYRDMSRTMNLSKHYVDLCAGIVGVTITRVTECQYCGTINP